MQLRRFVFAGLLALLSVSAFAQRQTREEYILKYKHLAAETMEKYGIPASVVMAQALLESDNGNSRLAKEAYNHFGIKCGVNWNGEIIRHDDDARNECFRVYGSAEESFLDHGRHLDTSPRYNKLFSLREDDYTGWANGLRECGYATNPNYGPMLIKIIEDNKLYLLDQGVEVSYADIRPETREVVVDENSGKVNVDQYTVTLDRNSGRSLHYNNGTAYVVAQEGDTFASIARDFRINVKKLLKYNDLTSEFALRPGDALYVKPKNKSSENGNISYVVRAGDTMHSISQQFGIRLKNLYRINNMSQNDRVREGQQIRLR
ncbi:glucosaminidase domain-containing protein [Alistipes sp. OttesenSCG-928-L06]|nr:glucosaminidase domain-containing protein [Alistipes sp. OttesenSCG-928-L06]